MRDKLTATVLLALALVAASAVTFAVPREGASPACRGRYADRRESPRRSGAARGPVCHLVRGGGRLRAVRQVKRLPLVYQQVRQVSRDAPCQIIVMEAQ